MVINLAPKRDDSHVPAVHVVGDVLTLNGESFDFSPLSEGATLPTSAVDSHWFSPNAPIARVNGEINLTLRLPHGPNPSRPVAFPEPIHVTADGPIALPFDPEPEPSQPLELRND